jgi:hypothetical protein
MNEGRKCSSVPMPLPKYGKLFHSFTAHFSMPIMLGKFVIGKWGSDRGNVWDTGREVYRSVEDGDESVFIEIGWQDQ